jgi:uncharacterized protein with beta-barrel porin domain
MAKCIIWPTGTPVRRHLLHVTALGVLTLAPTVALAQDLGSYAVVAGSTITNTGTTTISGNIALSPGTDFPGQGSIVQSNGTIYIADGAAAQAKSDLTAAFNMLMGQAATPLSGDLGGMTLSAGTYSFASAALLSTTLTLQGDSDDIFIIKVGSSLTTASSSSVILSGTVEARNVFFVVDQSATLGSNTTFHGQIMVGQSVSLGTGATIDCGAVYAQVGAVTMQSNTIKICTFVVAPGEITDILGDDITSNGGSISDALDDYITRVGPLPLSYQLLSVMSETALADALDQLGGEVATGVTPSGMQATESFLALLTGGTSGPGITRAPLGEEPLSGRTISVMGYAESPAPLADEPFGMFDAPPTATPWTAWIAGTADIGHREGDAGIGSHDLDTRAAAFAIGLEANPDPGTVFGMALSAGTTQFQLGDDSGSGDGTNVQAAIFGRADIDEAYVSGALVAGTHHMTTTRVVDIAGLDRLGAELDAIGLGAQLEAGYHFGWFTPFVALSGQSFATPAYSETAEEGSANYALSYEARTTERVTTTIGARGDWAMPMGEDGILTVSLMAGWEHDYMPDNAVEASFQVLPGSPFTTAGASGAQDSLVASAGTDFVFGNGFGLSTQLTGRISETALSYGGSARLGYRF